MPDRLDGGPKKQQSWDRNQGRKVVQPELSVWVHSGERLIAVRQEQGIFFHQESEWVMPRGDRIRPFVYIHQMGLGGTWSFGQKGIPGALEGASQ